MMRRALPKPLINEQGELEVPIATIKSIQFSMLKAEELEKIGVEVVKATVNSHHSSSDGGLNSGYQGAQSRKDKCKTCGEENRDCQSHTPFLRLPIPTFVTNCIRETLCIIRCICPYCSRCLMRPGHPQYEAIKSIKNHKKRIAEAQKICTKIAFCPIENSSIDPKIPSVFGEQPAPASQWQMFSDSVLHNRGCGGKQPNMEKDGLNILAQFADDEPPVRVHELAIFDMLYHMTAEDSEFLLGNTITKPHSLMTTILAIPPMASRPAHEANDGDDNWGQDSATSKYRVAARLSIELTNSLLSGSKKNDILISNRVIHGGKGGEGDTDETRTSKNGKKSAHSGASTKNKLANTGGGTHLLSEMHLRLPGGVPVGEWRRAICEKTRDLGIGLNGWTVEERKQHIALMAARKKAEAEEKQGSSELVPMSKKIRTPSMIFCELTAQLASLLASENVAKSCDSAGAAMAAAARQQYQQKLLEQNPTPGAKLNMPAPSMPSLHSRQQRAGNKQPSIGQSLVGKPGKLRKNCRGKRVNMSARTVATPDPNLNPVKIGVPVQNAIVLTNYEHIRYYNMHSITAMLRNGPNIHPGVNYVKTDKGITYNMSSRNPSVLTLQFKWVACTHLRNGKQIMDGRYPSLHKQSIMGHCTEITDSLAETLPGSGTTPKNADFDGDELNDHLPQSQEAIAETQEIMGVQHQLLSQRNAAALIYPVQDTPNAAYLITTPGTVFSYEESMQYLMQCPTWNGIMPWPTICVRNPSTGKMIPYISGNDLITATIPKGTYVIREPEKVVADAPKEIDMTCLPTTLIRAIASFMSPDAEEIANFAGVCEHVYARLTNDAKAISPFQRKCMLEELESADMKKRRLRNELTTRKFTTWTQNGLRIQNGYLCYGWLTREKIRESVTDMAKDPFLSACDRLECIPNFIHNLEQLCHAILMHVQITFGMEQTKNPDPVQIKKIIDTLVDWINRAASSDIIYSEDQINAVISRGRQLIEDIVIRHAHINSVVNGHRDGFFEIVSAGGKGNTANMVQIRATMLQQYTMGKRFKDGVPMYKNVNAALYSGLIIESLGHGLSAASHLYHAICGREGIADTAVKIRDVGYCERKLTSGAGSHLISAVYTVTTGDGKCAQQCFGDTNMDASRLERSTLHIHSQSEAQFEAEHKISALDWKNAFTNHRRVANELVLYKRFFSDIKNHRTQLRKFQLESFERTITSTVSVPVCFDRLWHRFPTASERGLLPATPDELRAQVNAKNELTVGYIIKKIYDMLDGLKVNYPLRRFTYYWALVLEWLSPKKVLTYYRWSVATFNAAVDFIAQQYHRSMLAPGEMQGMNCAQVMAELITQLTFNTFHFTGAASQLVGGIPRLKELINMQASLQTPAMSIMMNDAHNTEAYAQFVAFTIPCVYLRDLLTQAVDVRPFDCAFSTAEEQIHYAKLRTRFCHTESSSNSKLSEYAIHWKLDRKKCMSSRLSPRLIATKIQQYFADQVKICRAANFGLNTSSMNHAAAAGSSSTSSISTAAAAPVPHPTKKMKMATNSSCKFTDGHYWAVSAITDKEWTVSLRVNENSIVEYLPLWDKYASIHPQLGTRRHFSGIMGEAASLSVRLKGIRGIHSATVASQDEDVEHPITKATVKKTRWMVLTAGTNLERVLQLREIDPRGTRSNHIQEIEEHLGIGAARDATQREFQSLLSKSGMIYPGHTMFLARAMAFDGTMLPMNRHGIAKSKTSKLGICMFEMPLPTIASASVFGEKDELKGVDENTLIGNMGKMGTHFVNIVSVAPSGINVPKSNSTEASSPAPAPTASQMAVSSHKQWSPPYSNIADVPPHIMQLALRNILPYWRIRMPMLVLHPHLNLKRYVPSGPYFNNPIWTYVPTGVPNTSGNQVPVRMKMHSVTDYFSQLLSLDPSIKTTMPAAYSLVTFSSKYVAPIALPSAPMKITPLTLMPPPQSRASKPAESTTTTTSASSITKAKKRPFLRSKAFAPVKPNWSLDDAISNIKRQDTLSSPWRTPFTVAFLPVTSKMSSILDEFA